MDHFVFRICVTDQGYSKGPEQGNAYDCGVFASQALEMLSRGQPTFDFTQRDMDTLRKRMILEIGRGELYSGRLSSRDV
jgi:Ulp1 family protease